MLTRVWFLRAVLLHFLSPGRDAHGQGRVHAPVAGLDGGDQGLARGEGRAGGPA